MYLLQNKACLFLDGLTNYRRFSTTTPFVTFTASATNAGFSPTYQWSKNGVVIFTSNFNNTYSTNILANGDVISCTITSTATCVTTSTAVSNNLTITTSSTATPALAIIASQTTLCGSGFSSVNFTALPTNGGSFPSYQWKKNGVNVGTGVTLNLFGFVSGDVINCTLTSNLSCVATSNAISNDIVMAVTPFITPTITIVPSQSNICPGATNVVFTATISNGGPAPTYQWKKNGVDVGTNAPTYSDNSLTAGTMINCVLTTSLVSPCLTSTSRTSNTITMSPATLVTPFVSISTSANNICSGTRVTFTANPFNGGTAPQFQWRKNGANVGTNSNIYVDSLLVNNDVITCGLTSNASCLSTNTVFSSGLIMFVSTPVAPVVTITASQTAICTGTSPFITFTATPINGGISPSYEWKKNGVVVFISTLNTYSTGAVANGDVFSCTLTSNATCITTNTATSNSITLSTIAAAVPSVSISTTQTTLCGSGSTTLTFTALPTNGGSFPSYTWYRNRAFVGSGPTLNLFGFTNNDSIYCELTSNLSCATTTRATSNFIVITISPSLAPSVSVVASQTNICAGTNVIFTATAINGGTTPAYQWKKNGVNVGTNSPVYTDSTLSVGTQISCVLTSSIVSPCLFFPTAISNTVVMSSTPLVAPAVFVSTPTTFICSGRSVTFTANPVNGGTAPSYQWRKNGINVGTNSNIYVDSTLINSDLISCVLTSNANCLSTTTATSANIFMTVTTSVIPSVTIAASQSVICSGTSPTITFTATPVNGGFPTY